MNRLIAFALIMVCIISLAACNGIGASSAQSTSQIYLYGEKHGVVKILEKELELWREYYQNEGMRQLFVELPYYTGEFLNLWMKTADDNILEAIYTDTSGTSWHDPNVKEFYKKIKSDYPETVFHGTDVGHQYNSTGKRFLKYLEMNDMVDSEQYRLTQEAIEQGKYYYGHSDDVYRENTMTQNFMREFDKLNGESCMGIYGSAHTGLDAMDYTTKSVPCMANQLKDKYGNAVHSEDLSSIQDDTPERIDTITLNGKEYKASYFGKQVLTGFKDYSFREFWRLENAYDDLKDSPKTGDILPYNNYPIMYPSRLMCGRMYLCE